MPRIYAKGWSGPKANQSLGWSANITHGESGSPTYTSWNAMIQRCTNQNDDRWKDYGGRGITVCARWLIFENFLADMGHRPKGTSIDRIDNNGNYEPGNCRWATRKQQQNNMRRNHLLTFKGRTQTIKQWSDELHISANLIRTRISRGWPTARIFAPAHNVLLLTYKGKTLSVRQWTKITGVKDPTIRWRIENGMSVKEALTTPVRSY